MSYFYAFVISLLLGAAVVGIKTGLFAAGVAMLIVAYWDEISVWLQDQLDKFEVK